MFVQVKSLLATFINKLANQVITMRFTIMTVPSDAISCFKKSQSMSGEREVYHSKLGKSYQMDEIIALEKEFQVELRKMSSTGANKKCADCGASPTSWASCNLGIFLCINCAQVHRSIGTHISKIKNFSTYRWGPDEMEMMRANGNEKSNAIYLAKNPNPDRSNMQQHITDKYVNKRWV